MPLAAELLKASTVFIRQRKEMVELLGFETRNKYSIETETGSVIGFAAEQQKGFAGVLFRQLLGHWRSFEVHIFNAERMIELSAHHPFRFFFHRLDVRTPEGRVLGAVQRRFSILSKKFDVEDAAGNIVASVSSPFWRIWTFIFEHQGTAIGAVRKKWGGLIKESFLDADSFAVEFTSSALGAEQRMLLLSAAMFIDLLYFENKGGGAFSVWDMVPD